MPIVTLTTDWNNDDFYSGAIKGALLSACENVEIVTLSSSITPFRISEASFVVRNSFSHFPKKTVHLIMVGSDPEPGTDLLAASYGGHFFFTADNGLIGLLGDAEDPMVVKLPVDNGNGPGSFPALTVFAKNACRLLEGEKLEDLGPKKTDYRKQVPLRAAIENDTITGAIIYIDSYGNAITNISRELFERIRKGREFEIYVQSKHYRISNLNKQYSETQPGDLLAIFNSIDLLEIAIRNGSARNLLNLSTDSTIRVTFK